MIYFWFALFVAVVMMAVGGVLYGLHVYPEALPIRILVANKEIAGTIIGTAMAIIAAGAAFMSVQLQIGVQRRATQISETTYWQQQRNDADIALSGLKIVSEAVEKVKAAFDDIRAEPNPYYAAVRRLQPSGILDYTQWPPTGTDLVNWDANREIGILRIWHNRLFNPNAPAEERTEGEAEIKSAAERMVSLRERIAKSLSKYEKDRARAQSVLDSLDRAAR